MENLQKKTTHSLTTQKKSSVNVLGDREAVNAVKRSFPLVPFQPKEAEQKPCVSQ